MNEELTTIRLLRNLSVELRSPLTSILGFTNMLRQEIKDQPHLDMLGSIVVSGEKLLQTLDAVLLLASLEEQTGQSFEKIEVIAILKDRFDEYEPKFRAKGIDFIYSNSLSSCVLLADNNLLAQALNHLLDNALKYTEKGKVTMTAATAQENGDDLLEISICDTGRGIPTEELNRIFLPFTKGKKQPHLQEDGIGLGLTICKKAIEILNGELTVASKPKQGTTFLLRFKMLADAFQGTVPVQSTEAAEMPGIEELLGLFGGLPKVLLVEDNDMNAILITSMLNKYCRISRAKNGEEAIKMATENIYDFFLMDINLGAGLNGVEVTQKLKLTDQYRNRPFAAVTGYTLSDERDKLLNSGLDFYLGKPFKKEELMELIRSLMYLSFKARSSD